jgi:hypothetical protein
MASGFTGVHCNSKWIGTQADISDSSASIKAKGGKRTSEEFSKS